MKNKKGNRF